MNDPIIRATALRKSYSLGRRTLEVLRGVDLEVPAGEFLALRGSSGAGKSTLLHLLGGLDLPDSGTIRAKGMELTKLDATALTRFRNRDVGLIFQAFHLMPELDAFENVALPARMARRPLKESMDAAKNLLVRVGLGDRLDHRPGELSGGEQQRVAIARALVNRPALVLADEPTGNLDSKTGEEIVALLLELRREHGSTLVVATHDSRLADMADRVIHLIDGLIDA
jgi:predicted ABC-type transport system involved in lysophospholipase L1 biosynthesis ATPase subunit